MNIRTGLTALALTAAVLTSTAACGSEEPPAAGGTAAVLAPAALGAPSAVVSSRAKTQSSCHVSPTAIDSWRSRLPRCVTQHNRWLRHYSDDRRSLSR